jgi:acetyl esterase/lipase
VRLHAGLTAAGVTCDLKIYGGMTHNFALLAGHLSSADDVVSELSKALSQI